VGSGQLNRTFKDPSVRAYTYEGKSSIHWEDPSDSMLRFEGKERVELVAKNLNVTLIQNLSMKSMG
jgi:hypothetical protein